MDNKIKTVSVIKRLVKLVKHLWMYYIGAIGGAVLGFITTLLIPATLIDLAWQGLDGHRPSLRTLLLLLILGISRGLFRYLEHYFGHYVAFKTLYELRCMVFSKLRRLAPTKLDQQDSGRLLKMIGEDIEAMEVFFAHTVPPVLTATIVTLLLSGYYVIVSPYIALTALLSYFILAIILPRFSSQRLQPLLAKQTKVRKAYISLFLDSLKGMKELLQFGQTKSRLSQLEKQSKTVNACEKEVASLQYFQSALSFLMIGLSIIVVAAIALHGAQQGTFSLSAATKVIIIFSTSFAPYLELSRLPLGFKRAMGASREVLTLLDEKEVARTGQAFDEKISSITLDKVGFSYSNRKQMILENLSATFENHKIIGIMGESGVGKSTLMKLIMRWYDNTMGTIWINEKKISDLSARDIQKRIAYIPQIPQIFNQSIRDNLTLSNPDITDEMILEAAEKCRIKDIILSTEQGLDTVLNNEQKIFSAGELQRLELTRALLKKADCYIFDEPTSNLDSLNEASLIQVIREQCNGYVFLLSHRESTLACSDLIYKVDDKTLKLI